MLNEAPFSRACKIVFPARHVRKKIIQKDKKTRSLIRWWKPRAIAIPVLNRSRPTLQRKARRVPETNNNNNNDNKQCVYIYIYIYVYLQGPHSESRLRQPQELCRAAYTEPDSKHIFLKRTFKKSSLEVFSPSQRTFKQFSWEDFLF